MPMGRAVLVTGASRGIGRATAQAFAARGDRVALHYRDRGELAGQVLAGLPGEGHVLLRADLTDADEVRTMVDGAADALGGLDVVVNNAGIFLAHPVGETGYEDWQAAWRTVLDTNLVGPANVCWCALRHLGPGGVIVNVSSRGAFRGESQAPAYAASKAGLNALGQSLAKVLGSRGIAVSTVAPGYVATDMGNAALKSPRGPEIRAESPFNRVATPEEVAAAIIWLAEPDAQWASGTILDFNGASYLRT
jgi:3-oxoacyl-[acyl-carrier protein] reductase